MALQKWAAPAGSPLLSTQTATGDPGNQARVGIGASTSVVFAADGDIAVGATLKIHAAGLLTTTGTPTLSIAFGVYNVEISATAAAQTGVSGVPWYADVTAIVQSFSGPLPEVAYEYHVTGLTTTDVRGVGTGSASFSSGIASYYFVVGWDSGADDADSGDILTMSQADALWIG